MTIPTTRCVLIGKAGEEVRYLLPVDPSFTFDDDTFTVALKRNGTWIGATVYWPIVPMVVFGAAIGVPTANLRRFSSYDASLLLPGFSPCVICVRVHDGHPGAEKLLERLGFFKRGDVHTLIVPYTLDLTWFHSPRFTTRPR